MQTAITKNLKIWFILYGIYVLFLGLLGFISPTSIGTIFGANIHDPETTRVFCGLLIVFGFLGLYAASNKPWEVAKPILIAVILANVIYVIGVIINMNTTALHPAQAYIMVSILPLVYVVIFSIEYFRNNKL